MTGPGKRRVRGNQPLPVAGDVAFPDLDARLPDFTPDPGTAPLPRMLLAQAAIELRLALRHGEQILLTLIIPVLLTLLLVLGSLVATDGSSRADYFLPGILALAVVSSAFTGLAIATGFERKYGVLKRLGATAMPRSILLGGKTLAVLGIEALQLAVLSVLGLALGWQPRGTVVGAAVIVLLGTAAFAGLGLLLAGTLRAEATLAAANLVWFLLLLGGGLLLPLSRLSDSAAAVLQFLPSAALADGLRAVFQDGSALPAQPAFILLAWSVLAFAAAVRWFRWE
jgi:ABC-2 type transport system permease protein